MKTQELFTALDKCDRKYRKWLFTTSELRLLFRDGSAGNFHNQLSHMVATGYLRHVCRGIYANDRARSRHLSMYALARFLRPGELVYVSRESRLCDLGYISQQMLDYLTVTTRGRSRLFTTCYGRIEFTHTSRGVGELMPHLTFNTYHGIYEADATLAWRELKRSGRNTNLVLEQVEKYDDVELPE